jgi:excisionase family DNA binding protein
MDQNVQRQTLTVPQVALLLGIGRNSAYEAVHRGDIPSMRFGRRIVVPIDALGEQVSRAIRKSRNCDVMHDDYWDLWESQLHSETTSRAARKLATEIVAELS